MAQARSTSITRRSVVVGLAPTAAPVALAGADNAYAQAKPEKSLYERLGGVFAIAAVVDHFSDAVVKQPVVGQKSEPAVAGMAHQEPGKAARPQVHANAVGLQHFGWALQFTATRPGKTSLGAEEAHRDLRISPRNSMRSQLNLDGRWTSPRSRNPRRPKCWQPSPLTKTKSPPATPRPPRAAEAYVPSPNDPGQSKLGGIVSCARQGNLRVAEGAGSRHGGPAVHAVGCPKGFWGDRQPL